MRGQYKEAGKERLSWKCFCVSHREEIISEFKNSQHNLENMVIFIHDNKCILMKAMDVQTQTESWHPMAFFFFYKNHDICPLIC